MSVLYSGPTKTVGNTTTETSLFTATPTVPAGFMVNGTVFRLWLIGFYTTAAVAPTLQVKLKLGANTMLDSSAQLMPANQGSGNGWTLQAAINVEAAGVTGTAQCAGVLLFHSSATTVAGVDLLLAGTTVNTTIDNTIDVTVKWGTADANNSFQARAVVVEYLPTP